MNIIMILLLFLNIIYVALMIMAYKHGSDKVASISPWWCFYINTYDQYGKRLCKVGMALVTIIIVLAGYEYVL